MFNTCYKQHMAEITITLLQYRQRSSVQAIIKPLLKTENSNRIRDNSIANKFAAFEAKYGHNDNIV